MGASPVPTNTGKGQAEGSARGGWRCAGRRRLAEGEFRPEGTGLSLSLNFPIW